MIPVPNLIAGVLIGIFISSWSSVFYASLIWGVIFLIMVAFNGSSARDAFLEKAQSKHGIPKIAWYWIIEYWTGFATSLFFGTIVHFIMEIFR
jgi:phosphoglycerol transferase MdoB-like AlkP superfamily enzyme